MEMKGTRSRALLVWAGVGAAILIAAVIAVLIAALSGGTGGPQPVATPSVQPSGSSSSPSPVGPADTVVDPDVVARGWVPEPITRDEDAYARAALEAAGTFDTTHSTRWEWVVWLNTWFTPSPLYDAEQDALDQMARYQAELDQAVVLPSALWDDLARGDGRVVSRVVGEIAYLEMPETTEKSVWTATADVVMTYTSAAPDGEVSYDETVRVSVQVVCDGQSLPTPNSAQQAGDCKVVRFFDEAVG